jgi:hypothetical protein
MIQFTKSGVDVTDSSQRLAEAREEFKGRRMLRLPGLLSKELIASVRLGLEQDGFEEPPPLDPNSPDAIYRGAYQGGKVGYDLRDGDTARLIKDRTNDPRLLSFVEAITGAPPLQRCIGRVFRIFPMPDDLPWHTDAEGGRLADLIIDLSAIKHQGGLFQMRDAHTQQVFNEVGDMEFGDGLLIRISPDIEHHYKAVTGTIPKATFSGWFVPTSSPR